MRILIAGDFVVDSSYSTNNISQEVFDLFQCSDFNIINLEAPITNSNDKLLKTGLHLKSYKNSTVHLLEKLNVDLCTLANNHVLDYNEQGVVDTVNTCRDYNIQTVGAGRNKEEAARIFYKDSQAGKIAIINIAENEWASATETSAGANGMDLIDDVNKIQEAKSNSDFVFVIVHGGHEYYNLPSPRMQKQYRFYVDNGADLVVGHHTHCISGMEIYKDVPIYYSLGNFLFTRSSKYDGWYKGIVLEVKIINSKIRTREFFVRQSKEDFNLTLLRGKSEEKIQRRFKDLSDIIASNERLIAKWKDYIREKSMVYSRYWSPFSCINNRFVRGILFKFSFLFPSKRGQTLWLNLLRCETHRDMSKEVLKNNIQRK